MSQQTEFIPYEQALELKELGFDGSYFGYYDIIDEYTHKFYICYKKNDNVFSYELGAPLYQQAFRWFREKHNIVFYLNMVGVNLYYYVIGTEPFLSFKTYEEAELACLKKLIEIVKYK